jgi:hypothetical protein
MAPQRGCRIGDAGGKEFALRNNAMSATEVIPPKSILSTWSDYDWDQDSGVQVETLQDMDRILVRTHNSVYELIVRSGAPGDVMVRGGKFFPTFTRVLLSGSSLGGSFLKRLGIYVGFRMELLLDGGTIVTSPVTAISVCPLESSNAAGLH